MERHIWRFHEWDRKMKIKKFKDELKELTDSIDGDVRKEIKEEFEKNGWDTGNL